MIELRDDRLARGAARYSLRNSAEFKEEDHPRAEDGKFGSGGSSGKSEPEIPSGKEDYAEAIDHMDDGSLSTDEPSGKIASALYNWTEGSGGINESLNKILSGEEDDSATGTSAKIIMENIKNNSEEQPLLWRGMNGDFSNYSEGDTIDMNNGFTSFSDDLGIAESFAKGASVENPSGKGAVFVIENKKALKTPGRYSRESEYITMPSSYKITESNYDEDEDLYTFTIEEIDASS